ncbi:MAG: molybdate ABC transporter substrate-binding protein [Caulobacter sp.]|nr:molybdate ABC transporter substrate-binding protein [Caulobacter sp.]
MISRRHLTAGLALAVPATLAGGGLVSARGGAITLFAAASLETALTAIGRSYRDRPGAPLRLAFGASSAMARQIAQGAPADLFISADIDWMDWLQARGGVVAGTRRNLLANRLVLIAPKASNVRLRIGPGMPLAAALGGGRLAVADPAAVPAGKYARQALTHLGVWDSVQARLVPAENVRTALAYVARGEAPLGVVYATDAAVEPRVRVIGFFPDASHRPIVYPAALVRDSVAGRAVLSHLSSPAAMASFRAQGFRQP